jgi:hypothetical protein
VTWPCGRAGVAGSGCNELNAPLLNIQMPNHDFPIVDQANNRVIEITRAGRIAWGFARGLSAAAFASRLPNGNTPIVDSGHAWVLVGTPDRAVVFQCFTNRGAGTKLPALPTNAVRIVGGDTIA